MKKSYELSVTTQGPTYPPSEIMNENGDYIVIGRVNRLSDEGQVISTWDKAIVSTDSHTPEFGSQSPYNIVEDLDYSNPDHYNMVLCTLPLPLPNNNYPMVFAPQQLPDPLSITRKSIPFHKVIPPDTRLEDGLRNTTPITLGQWINAIGEVTVNISNDRRFADFNFEFYNLIPNSLYTIMSLRQGDLDPKRITRPGPLGIPNVLITDNNGYAVFHARLPNPFPSNDQPGSNRIVNVILLWMSNRMSHGGAIGMHGLGGDVHAQLKLKEFSFFEFETRN